MTNFLAPTHYIPLPPLARLVYCLCSYSLLLPLACLALDAPIPLDICPLICYDILGSVSPSPCFLSTFLVVN